MDENYIETLWKLVIINGIIFILFKYICQLFIGIGSTWKLHSTADENSEANLQIDDLEEAIFVHFIQWFYVNLTDKTIFNLDHDI